MIIIDANGEKLNGQHIRRLHYELMERTDCHRLQQNFRNKYWWIMHPDQVQHCENSLIVSITIREESCNPELPPPYSKTILNAPVERILEFPLNLALLLSEREIVAMIVNIGI